MDDRCNRAPGPQWDFYGDCWHAGGEKEAFLIVSIGEAVPGAIPLQGAGELTDEDRRKLDSQGIPADCCDDVSIVSARINLAPNYQLAMEEVGTTERGLTRGYILRKLEEFMNSVEKPAAYIFYIGHGKKGTGDWCFSDGFITFRDIVHLYTTTKMKNKLLAIVNNSSHSGSWVKECYQYLDEQGVRACGHSAAEKAVLLKVFSSCKPSEEANTLVYSVRGMENDKNTSILSYWSTRSGKELCKNQHALGMDFTSLRCGRTPQDPCSLTSPEYTWTKVSQGDLVYVVKGEDRGRSAWYYVRIVDDEDTVCAFKAALEDNTIDLSRYDQILESGWGKVPPNEIQDEMEKQYHAVYK